MESVSEISYCFTLPDGSVERFTVNLDDETMTLHGLDDSLDLPEWTRLEYHQCSHCPLNKENNENCPLAVSIVPMFRCFNRIYSYDKVDLLVKMECREIRVKISAQQGVSSLIGLLIAVSGCPHTAFFKPMARFHLPFSSELETIYRASSMFMLAQYFRQQEGKSVDLSLDGLGEIYNDVNLVNKGITKRLQAASQSDTTINAIVLLDMFAFSVQLSLDGALEELKPFFEAYLK